MSEEFGPAAAVFVEEISVPASAIDRNGHVNNVVFVQWMQDMAVRHFASAGAFACTSAIGGGWVVRSHQVEYLGPAFAGDQLEARTWIVSFGRVRSLRRYEFVRRSDARLLVRGETDWVFVNTATGKPMSIPKEIAGKFTVA